MRRVEVLFAFEVFHPRRFIPGGGIAGTRTQYRAVRGVEGDYRFESKGVTAKTFRPFMWTNGVEGIVGHYSAIKNSNIRHFFENTEQAEAWVAARSAS